MTKVIAGALLVAAALLYGFRLDQVPTYISPDEAIISTDAHLLATTGQDVTGTTLPLYFHIQMPGQKRSGWFTPVIFYLSAAFQKVLPFAEWSVRMPSVFVGLLNLVLIYTLARRVFDSAWMGMCAAGLLALSPAHFIFSRFALDYLYPVPFLLAWLLCLQRAMREQSTTWLLAAGLCLGLGFYSYAAAVLLVPMFLAATVLVWFAQTDNWKSGAWAAAGFAAPLVAFAIWFVSHPGALSNTATRYALYDAQSLNMLQGLREILSFPNIERMTSLYWSFFNPSFLFLSGDQSMTFSTRAAGVFPTMLVILLPMGVYQILARERTPFNWLMLAGFVLAPLPAVLVPEAGAANRATAMLPFGAMLGTFGVACLWRMDVVRFAKAGARAGGLAALAFGLAYAAWTLTSEQRVGGLAVAVVVIGAVLVAFGWLAKQLRHGPALAACILALAVLQFGSFAQDYFGDYRVRVNSWLGGNLRGALEAIIERQPAGGESRVYFAHLQAGSGLADIRNYWMDAYWRFYLTKHQREDLLARTSAFEPEALASLPPGSVILGNLDDRVVQGLVASGQVRAVQTIPELDREAFFVLLERSGS